MNHTAEAAEVPRSPSPSSACNRFEPLNANSGDHTGIFRAFQSPNRFLESLEDSALMYSTERFMKGELDCIKLFIEVRLLYFIVCYRNNVTTKSTDYN